MARERSRTPRLDQPRETRRTLISRPQVDPEAFARFAERFARFMGTARFLVYMTVFVVVWLAWNTFAPDALQHLAVNAELAVSAFAGRRVYAEGADGEEKDDGERNDEDAELQLCIHKKTTSGHYKTATLDASE